MRCSCATHRAGYDRRYVGRVDRGWPRWLAFIACPPGSDNYEQAVEFLAEYERAAVEGRIGVGFLGSVIIDDAKTAREITNTFGLRRPA